MTDRSPLIGPAFSAPSSSDASSEIDGPPVSTRGPVGYLAFYWGLGGVIALLAMAIVRLLAISIDAFSFSLTWTHWAVFITSVLIMAYAEGYRTFQKTWAPRVVKRAFQLQQQWTPFRLILAPFYCMSFFHATRKRRLTAWITTVCIVLLIVLMNRMAQPWRGLVDAGVVVGLSWGIACLILQAISQLSTNAKNNRGTS
ncbi:MAG: hypothetical protein AB8B64_00010 [Granulosicoccus sp.]